MRPYPSFPRCNAGTSERKYFINNMLIILNSLFPVFAVLILGYVLKRYRLTDEKFLKISDNLVYFIFFPVLLFWKIGGTYAADDVYRNFCVAVICGIFIICLSSCIFLKLFGISEYQSGSFSQSCYRFNSYIGVAVIMNTMGEEGIKPFGILIGFVIPFINVLAVSTLIWFSGKDFSAHERIRFTVKALISNPLILGCLAGCLYARLFNGFPVFLENTFRMISFATIPLSLISIGSTLTFASMKGHFKVSFIAAIIKLLIFPVTGYFLLKLFTVTDILFKVGMIFFALPTATSVYILSSQLNSDTDLASASIVLSTVLSFFSLSAVLLILNR